MEPLNSFIFTSKVPNQLEYHTTPVSNRINVVFTSTLQSDIE